MGDCKQIGGTPIVKCRCRYPSPLFFGRAKECSACGHSLALHDPVHGCEAEVSESQRVATEEDFCFIATAVYGEDAVETNRLRDFRDDALLSNSLGRVLCHVYYRTSPSVSRLLRRHGALASAARLVLDPVVGLLAQAYGRRKTDGDGTGSGDTS